MRYLFGIKCLSFSRRAFTMVEVSIAIAISLMGIVAIISVFIASSKMAVESFLRNRAAMEARIVIDRLTSDVRAAVSLENTAGSFSASTNTLILKLPAINGSGFPVDIDAKFDYVVYHQNGEQPSDLVRTVIADGSSTRVDEEAIVGRSADSNVAIKGAYSAQPDALGAYVINYEFTSVQEYGSKSYEKPVAGSVRLRNRI